MVDFNKDATVTTPAMELVKILILQRRNDTIEAIESYNKQDCQGVQADVSVVRSRLNSLFLELQPALQRHLTKDDTEYQKLKTQVLSQEIEELLKAFEFINGWIDKIELTKIDSRIVYDSTMAEDENTKKGL